MARDLRVCLCRAISPSMGVPIAPLVGVPGPGAALLAHGVHLLLGNASLGVPQHLPPHPE